MNKIIDNLFNKITYLPLKFKKKLFKHFQGIRLVLLLGNDNKPKKKMKVKASSLISWS